MAASPKAKIQAKRVGELLCQGHGFLDACPRLVRIAQVPQRRGGIAAAQHPGILPMEEHRGTVLLGLIEGDALGKMRVRRGDRSLLEYRRPHVSMRRHQHRWVVDVVRQGQELLAQGVRRLELRAHIMMIPQPTQHGEQLVRRVQGAQRCRAAV